MMAIRRWKAPLEGGDGFALYENREHSSFKTVTDALGAFSDAGDALTAALSIWEEAIGFALARTPSQD